MKEFSHLSGFYKGLNDRTALILDLITSNLIFTFFLLMVDYIQTMLIWILLLKLNFFFCLSKGIDICYLLVFILAIYFHMPKQQPLPQVFL